MFWALGPGALGGFVCSMQAEGRRKEKSTRPGPDQDEGQDLERRKEGQEGQEVAGKARKWTTDDGPDRTRFGFGMEGRKEGRREEVRSPGQGPRGPGFEG